MENVTIILITYKSEKIVASFLEKVPKNLPVIIVDNSNSSELKTNVENIYSNVQVFLSENNGVSSALNYAVSKIKTKYFLQISPDIEFDFKDLKIFQKLAENLNDDFATIGPRHLNVDEKGHKQISNKIDFGIIDSIVGSCMYMNKKNFLDIGGFDENFFLYFEETEFCYRAKRLNYKSYQTNNSNVTSLGRSVNIEREEDKEDLDNLLIWHFIWSKFYFYKKKYGKNIALIIFIPIILRIYFKIMVNKLLNNKKNLKKYKYRLDGLINSIKGNKSYLR